MYMYMYMYVYIYNMYTYIYIYMCKSLIKVYTYIFRCSYNGRSNSSPQATSRQLLIPGTMPYPAPKRPRQFQLGIPLNALTMHGSPTVGVDVQ